MASIERRETETGQVRYRVKVRLRGYPIQTATFKRKTDAKKWASDTESEIRKGKHFKTSEARRHTFADVVDRYRKSILPSYKAKEQKKRAAQLEWWRAQLGAFRLSDVTPALVVECRERLQAGGGPSGRPASAATQNRYLAALSHALSMAERDWGWIESNPCRKIRRPSEPRGRVRFLTDGEREALLAACRTSADVRLYPLVSLALLTGARQGELLNLRWADVDLNRQIAVAHDTKNGERRALPLSAQALEVLRDLGKVRRVATDLIFANQKGSATFPRNAWQAALKGAQIEDFRFHDLRHSAASYLAMSGATLAEIAGVLGHKTLAMVKRYSHLTEQHTSEVVARMNEKFLAS